MTREFKAANYEETLNLSVTLGEALPPNQLARFVVDVIRQLDPSAVYARYASVGGEAFASEILPGLLFYDYAIGVFSLRKIEKATYYYNDTSYYYDTLRVTLTGDIPTKEAAVRKRQQHLALPTLTGKPE